MPIPLWLATRLTFFVDKVIQMTERFLGVRRAWHEGNAAKAAAHKARRELRVLQPEIIIAFSDGINGSLLVKHVSGPDAWDIQVKRITNGHWEARPKIINYLKSDTIDRIDMTFSPITERAKTDQLSGGHMSELFFFMRSVEIGPIYVSVTYRSAPEGHRIKRKFEIAYDPDSNSLSCSRLRMAARIKRLVFRR